MKNEKVLLRSGWCKANIVCEGLSKMQHVHDDDNGSDDEHAIASVDDHQHKIDTLP